MNSEEDELNRIEREASLRKAAVKSAVGKHTIDMAREAGIGLEDEDHYQVINLAELEAFEALVRADERKSWPDEMEAMERQVNILTDALAEQPAQQCRTDGRCQYAIDSGAEGMGHCPPGKCCMPAQQALDKMAENARELGLDYEPAQPVVWHDAPQTIYLQVCPEADHCEVRFADHDEVTWCQDKIHDSDIAYVRASTTPQPPAQPLTEEQIAKCYETTGHYQTLRPQDRFAVFALARAIEAAHGIKENK